MPTEAQLTFATLNVRGLSAKKKQSQVHRLLTEQDLDVVALQETKVEGEDETGSMVQRFTARYFACVSHAVGNSAGCVLFLKKHSGLEVESVRSCVLGRFVVCDFALNNVEWRVICLYAPNPREDRQNFFRTLRQYLTNERQIIMMGDFNCVLSPQDKTSSSPYKDASTDLLAELIDEFGLVDVAKCLENGRDVRFTHFQGTSHARLDRFYVSLELIPKCQSYSVHPVSFSDHCLVKCSVGPRKQKTTFSWDLWKLNAKLLRDEIFTDTVKEKIEEFKNEDNKIGEQWELFKEAIKVKAIERSSCIRYEEKMKEGMLRHTLQRLTIEEGKTPGVFKDDIGKLEHQLELMDEERYRGALVRARAERLAMGETPTKRALGIEKARVRQNTIDKIEWEGRTSSKKEDIHQFFFEYYQQLFAYRPCNLETFRREYLSCMPILEDETKDSLEQPISVEEVKAAIDNLNSGKSPGPDGLSAAFYKHFKAEVSPILTAMFNEAFRMKTLPPSYASSHTVLIPKTEETEKLKSVTSCRPIALTNVDYKVFMKVLAQRLQTVITTLVGPHRTCGIKGRTITTNIHTARCVLECCDATGDAVALLQLDLQKAFDCVSHDILLSILDHIKVGAVIRDGVTLAYHKCTTRLIINKSLGAPINVQRSVRQGCPLSPLLFCIYIEMSCLTIIKNDQIRGFRLHTREVKLLAYADDVAVFCHNKESVVHVVEIVKRFGVVTGSLVNWGKCVGFWHGDWPTTPEFFANINWVTHPVKYLGTPLEYYRDSEPYWRAQAQKLREKADNWRGSGLSMFARANVCNVFLASKLWYVMQVLHCSRVNVQKLHRVFAVFVWASSWERSSRTNLFRRVQEGGLGLTHLFVRQLVNRFLFFRDVRDPFLRTVCQLRLGRVLPNFVVTSGRMSGGLHGYLKEVVDAVRFLSVRFSKEYLSTVTRRKLYNDVCSVILPVPMYRALYAGGPGQNVLKRVKKMLVPSGVKSFFFKLHTNTLTTKTWMEERGLFVPWGTHCTLCKKPETVDHVFLHCWEGVFFWDVLQRTMRKELPLSPHGIRYLAVDDDDGMPLDMIMLLGLQSIWRARSAYVYSDVDARSSRVYFGEYISRYIEEQKLHECVPEWFSSVEPLATLKPF